MQDFCVNSPFSNMIRYLITKIECVAKESSDPPVVRWKFLGLNISVSGAGLVGDLSRPPHWANAIIILILNRFYTTCEWCLLDTAVFEVFKITYDLCITTSITYDLWRSEWKVWYFLAGYKIYYFGDVDYKLLVTGWILGAQVIWHVNQQVGPLFFCSFAFVGIFFPLFVFFHWKA